MIATKQAKSLICKLTQQMLLAGVIMLLTACSPIQGTPPATQYEATVATAWFDLTLQLVKETPGFSPPVASRSFGYLGVALYETVRPGMPAFQSLAGQLNELYTLPQPQPLARYHWPLAVNSSLATLLRLLFPTATPENLAAIDALEQQLSRELAVEVDAATVAHSAAWGKAVAEAIYIWSTSDGGHEGYTRNFPADFSSPNGPGLWVSTPPDFAMALQPYWGQNRPFVLATPEDCPALPPLTYSEEEGSPFYIDAFEVYTVGLQRTAEQTDIARFWADTPGQTPTPAGHWIAIGGQILRESESSLDVAAEAYAKVGMVVADSFITCWYTKYLYNVMRPISYIQQIIDPSWNTPDISDPVITPPFPEYTSGHSVQSSAAAAVLTSLFGENYGFTDHTHDGLGLAPRTYPSFTAAAEDAAISRLYGGIHYRSAIEQGLLQGHCVADKIITLHFRQ